MQLFHLAIVAFFLSFLVLVASGQTSASNTALNLRIKAGTDFSLVAAADSPAASTFVDCQRQDRFLRITLDGTRLGANDPQVNVTLRGFSIRNCSPRPDPGTTALEGGALYYSAGTNRLPMHISLESMEFVNCSTPETGTLAFNGGAISLRGPGSNKRDSIEDAIAEYKTKRETMERRDSLVAQTTPFLLSVDNSFFRSCRTPTGSGAAISLIRFQSIIRSTLFDKNVATHSGGAILATDATIDFTEATFTFNKARDGSVLYGETSTITLNKCEVNRNSASYSGTMALYIGIVWVNAGRYTDNQAQRSGGAFNGLRYSVFHINNAEFSRNDGGLAGGALYLDSDSIASVDSSNFTANKGGDGAAVHIDVHASANITNSRFINNLGRRGGAIYAHTAEQTYISGSTFEQNAADAGPAFWCANSVLYFSDTTLTSNATKQGADPIKSSFYCSTSPPYTKCYVRGDSRWDSACAGAYAPTVPYTPETPVTEIGGLPVWFVATIIALGAVIFLAALGCVVIAILRRKHRLQAQRLADELDNNQTQWNSVDVVDGAGLEDDAVPIQAEDIDDLVGRPTHFSTGNGKSIMDDD